jgi:DNA-directed RNA polymerase subunit RPC12/RpoP
MYEGVRQKEQMNAANYDNCPYCGQRVLMGAMRCLKCGKILKTPEEQMSSIQNLKESRKGFNTGRYLKFIILLIAIGIIYNFYSDQIVGLIRSLLGE